MRQITFLDKDITQGDIVFAFFIAFYILYLQKSHLADKNEELYQMLNSVWLMYIAVFYLFFRMTRKPYLSLIMTIFLYLLREVLLNKSSRYAIVKRETYDYNKPTIDEEFMRL
jgi:hypothetical protein